MAPRFPLFLDLTNAPCLVVGGGEVGTRRTETLLRCGAKVKVVSTAFSEALVAWAAAETHAGSLDLVERSFREVDLLGVRLAVAATNVRDVNRQVGEFCKAKNISVSVCDSQPESSFFFPALITRGELSVGICTNGASPAVSKQVREVIEMVLPEDFGDRITRFDRKQKEDAQ